MRSLILALCVVALPASTAFAGAPRDYTHDTPHTFRAPKPKQEWVLVTFRNPTLHTLIVRTGDADFRVQANSRMSLRITVGATVERRDEYNSHRERETLMKVAPGDNLREITLS